MTASDGKKATASGDFLMGSALVRTSNFAYLLKSIQDALPDAGKEENMGKMFDAGKASNFNGLEAHMVRLKVEREGLEKKARPDGKVYDQTVPVVDLLHKLPWEKKAPPGVKGATGKAALSKAAAPATGAKDPASATPPSTDYESKAIMMVGQQVAQLGAGGSITRDDLNAVLFESIKIVKEKNAIIQYTFKSDWLAEKAEEGGWVFDTENDTLSPVE
jgi:hypothetical protein